MNLSVVIVNWNSREDLEACLTALAEQTHPDLELIVVDNDSQDGSQAMVTERFPEVMLLAQSENLGFAEGCNRGIAASTADWVCMLNNDTTAEPGWAAALVRAAEGADERCGMLQSKLLFMEDPLKINSTGIVLNRAGRGNDRDEGKPRDHRQSADEIFCPTAGACAYRRSMLDAIKLSTGWLDSTYFCYLEDLDLGWRARLHGWTARYVPDSVVLHRYHGSTRRRGRRWLRRMSNTNHFRTLLKNASWPFMVRNVPRCTVEVLGLLTAGGPSAVADAFRAARHAYVVRREVDALRTVDREALEQRWIDRG